MRQLDMAVNETCMIYFYFIFEFYYCFRGFNIEHIMKKGKPEHLTFTSLISSSRPCFYKLFDLIYFDRIFHTFLPEVLFL